MGHLQDQILKMWKDAAERMPAIEQPQPQLHIQKKIDPLLDLTEGMSQKNFLKKPTPEEIARRIYNNSKNKRRFL